MEKGFEIKCLDHGFVRYIDHMGTDLDILEAARLSYKSPSKGPEADKKLLHYLWKNKHTSPFEMIKLKVNIKLPIFVMRQYVRHRMQNLNELSARYTELPNEFYVPTVWRRQDTKNKQGSVADDAFRPVLNYYTGSDLSNPQPEGWILEPATDLLRKHCESSYNLYTRMLEGGIAKEMARMVLPVNIYTEIYACWDMKNLIHFIGLRDDSHAQAEIQVYGKVIKEIARELFPWTIEAYEKYKWVIQEEACSVESQ